jgi:hypothetical protein
MTDWMRKGLCRGNDSAIWYPLIVDDHGVEWYDDGTIWQAFGDTAEYYDKARSICGGCPVASKCLDYAFAERQFYGMWGGLTPIERRRIERSERRRLLKERRQTCSTP